MLPEHSPEWHDLQDEGAAQGAKVAAEAEASKLAEMQAKAALVYSGCGGGGGGSGGGEEGQGGGGGEETSEQLLARKKVEADMQLLLASEEELAERANDSDTVKGGRVDCDKGNLEACFQLGLAYQVRRTK